MTAFEILLNNFYDSIERNEPKTNRIPGSQNSSELFEAIRQFIDTSFSHGQNLSYKKPLSELVEKAASLFQNANHETWSKVKYTFMENDLHIIRRDRNKSDIENLKIRLDHSF